MHLSHRAGSARWTEGAEFANGARPGRENHAGAVRRSARLEACMPRVALWGASARRRSNGCAATSPARRLLTNGSRNGAGDVVLQLKSAWRDGTTHIVISPLEFMQRLAALVPRPRLHLMRFHGVLAPHARLRAALVPGPPQNTSEPAHEHTHGTPRRRSLSAVAQARLRHRHRALPGLWRRAKDDRRHRRARRDGQDPHASGLARARAAALDLRGRWRCSRRPDPARQKRFRNRTDDPARSRLRPTGQRASKCTAVGRFEELENAARGGFHPTPGDGPLCPTGDTVANREKGVV